jgi:hypothetical protein
VKCLKNLPPAAVGSGQLARGGSPMFLSKKRQDGLRFDRIAPLESDRPGEYHCYPFAFMSIMSPVLAAVEF